MPKRRSRGEGTIYQRKDGLWSGQITLPDGKRKTKYGKTQKIVRDWLVLQQSNIRSGTWGATDNTRLGVFLTTYLDDVASKQVRPSTLDGYRHAVCNHIIPAVGDIRLNALRPDHLQHFYNGLIEKGLAPGSVLVIHGVLHQALRQATEWGIIVRNVASLVHPPRRRGEAPQLPTQEQLGQMLGATVGHWLHPFIYLAVATGLRRGELLALKWSDIDWAKKTLQVMRIASIENNRIVVTEPKTARSRRLVTLSDGALEELRRWREQSAGEYIFPTRYGTVKSPHDLESSWRALLKRTGLPHLRFNSLRHLHATLLLEAGISPKVVSERLGHTNISITLDLYSHVTAPLQQQAADTIGRAMDGLPVQ